MGVASSDGDTSTATTALVSPSSVHVHRVNEASLMLRYSPPFIATSKITPLPLVRVMSMNSLFGMDDSSYAMVKESDADVEMEMSEASDNVMVLNVAFCRTSFPSDASMREDVREVESPVMDT